MSETYIERWVDKLEGKLADGWVLVSGVIDGCWCTDGQVSYTCDSCRIMDYDTISAHDAIGKVPVPVNSKWHLFIIPDVSVGLHRPHTSRTGWSTQGNFRVVSHIWHSAWWDTVQSTQVLIRIPKMLNLIQAIELSSFSESKSGHDH